MVRANDGSLEQRPHVFESVSVNISAHPFFLAVVDRCVDRVLISDAFVVAGFISNDQGRLVCDLCFDERMKDLAGWGLAANLQSNLTATFNRTEYHCFVIVMCDNLYELAF